MEALTAVAAGTDSCEDLSESDLKIKAILYLVECYDRVSNEECLNPKVCMFVCNHNMLMDPAYVNN